MMFKTVYTNICICMCWQLVETYCPFFVNFIVPLLFCFIDNDADLSGKVNQAIRLGPTDRLILCGKKHPL